jgi:hypothetical protein
VRSRFESVRSMASRHQRGGPQNLGRIGQMDDPFGQSPEMNALSDFATQLENAKLIDPTGLETEREALEVKVLDADRRIRACGGIPNSLRASYMSFRSDWEAFYRKDLPVVGLPGFASQDWQKFKALKATFGDLVAQMTAYCDMGAPDTPAGSWPISLGTIAIVGGLVFLGIAAVVASNVYGASKGIGTAVGNAVGGKASRALAKSE